MEYKTFGELSREEKHALFTAWMDEKTIEIRFDDGNWHPVDLPSWVPEREYRIAPTKPSIDWAEVDPHPSHI